VTATDTEQALTLRAQRSYRVHVCRSGDDPHAVVPEVRMKLSAVVACVGRSSCEYGARAGLERLSRLSGTFVCCFPPSTRFTEADGSVASATFEDVDYVVPFAARTPRINDAQGELQRDCSSG
jgi:hypothetical protein